ncbi:MAG: TIGR02186 family protein, partial [Sphingopyxis sp.]|nr:TIGR02186 family protein [Sphingopyxis sp.]
LVDLYQRLGLFVEDSNAVEISDGVLYRARIPVPARVPVGTYRAETYLISRGRVIAVASRPVEIRKTGFERSVARAAERNGLLYGIVAVMLSVGLGYLASRLFKSR